nr:hypothetical protein [Ruminococcus sp.]
DEKPNEKSVRGFCEKNNCQYQPVPVNRICKRLCDCNQMDIIRSGGVLGLDSNYVSIISNKELYKTQRNRFKYYFNSMVYGFDYIYDLYKEIVIPVVGESKKAIVALQLDLSSKMV